MAQRVLIVDDDHKLVRLLRASLEQAGYQVMVAYNGETAPHALRHTPPGDEVTVEVLAEEVSEAARSPKAEKMEIAIADTGEGIAREHIAHVFERFWRADPARSRGDGEAPLGSGTGLGLAVAQSLVEAQGGRIWVESTPGERTVFHFALPLVQPDH